MGKNSAQNQAAYGFFSIIVNLARFLLSLSLSLSKDSLESFFKDDSVQKAGWSFALAKLRAVRVADSHSPESFFKDDSVQKAGWSFALAKLRAVRAADSHSLESFFTRDDSTPKTMPGFCVCGRPGFFVLIQI
jgi:hypothetical protein